MQYQNIMYNKKTIIVSNRLPIRIEKNNNELQFIPSEGGLATGLGSIYQQGNNIWVGWPGYNPESPEEEEFIRQELQQLNLAPVFLTDEEIQGYYEGFSNEVLWPVFHYRLSYAVYDTDNWNTYAQVNKKFAESIKKQDIQETDEVWIHDYQLMLLPQLVREQYENISIGYFQHIPFPPNELFRSIPWRDELIQGLLGADLIAFHTFNDAQHFLDACMHLLGLPLHNNAVQIEDRTVFVEVYPMGIDFNKFSQLATSPEIQERANEIKDFYQNRQIILCIDRLDYSKGIIERLQAYESLLIERPELREKIMLYMLVVPSRDSVPQYKALRDEIDRTVGHINSVYGVNEWIPIAYFYNSFELEELSALYVASDVCLITSIRDGMNLVCKEYIASKEQTSGVLVLSELAGASKELIDAILVNPNSIDQIREGLAQALFMNEVEKRQRMDENIAVVKKFNVNHWVSIFFNRLREIKSLQQEEKARKVKIEVKDFILRQYSSATKRLLFLDYDGTLMHFHRDADAAIPNKELYATLAELQSNPSTQVVIISGRPQHTLQKWFGNRDIFLVAEHGACSNYPDFQWRYKDGLSTGWKEPVKEIMNKFADRTAGSFVEEKSYALAWHYRKAQIGLGKLKAQELVLNLQHLISQHNLQLLLGHKVIEVKNSELNKGKAAIEIVADYKPDFIFAIGDDATDEDMFMELPDNSITIKVGNDKSRANYYVESQKEALHLVESLAQTK